MKCGAERKKFETKTREPIVDLKIIHEKIGFVLKLKYAWKY